MQQTVNERKRTTLDHMASRNPLVFAIAIFVTGFFCGVGFSAYRFGSESLSGSSTAQKTNYAQMAKALARDLTENPENTNAWIQLGDVYFDSDQYAKAIDAYQKALSLNPKNADVLTDLGIMYRRVGQPRQSIQSFEKAIAIDPKHESSRLNKGIVLMHDLKNKAGAIQAWEELLEINPLAMARDNQSVDQLVKHYKEHETDTAN